MGTHHKTAPANKTFSKRFQVNAAWEGVGVSSSSNAGPRDVCALACPPPAAKDVGDMRPPIKPITAAAKTMKGKGTFSAKIATKLAAAIAIKKLFFNALEPMRCAACTTMAVTAGLMP